MEVRDGSTILAPLLTSACGSVLPSTQHGTGDALYVRYFNNMTHHHSGFKAVVEIGEWFKKLCLFVMINLYSCSASRAI